MSEKTWRKDKGLDRYEILRELAADFLRKKYGIRNAKTGLQYGISRPISLYGMRNERINPPYMFKEYGSEDFSLKSQTPESILAGKPSSCSKSPINETSGYSGLIETLKTEKGNVKPERTELTQKKSLEIEELLEKVEDLFEEDSELETKLENDSAECEDNSEDDSSITEKLEMPEDLPESEEKEDEEIEDAEKV